MLGTHKFCKYNKKKHIRYLLQNTVDPPSPITQHSSAPPLPPHPPTRPCARVRARHTNTQPQLQSVLAVRGTNGVRPLQCVAQRRGVTAVPALGLSRPGLPEDCRQSETLLLWVSLLCTKKEQELDVVD